MELKLPSQKRQLLQLKLYVDYFNNKLKKRSNDLFSLTRNNIFNIGKTTLITDSNPYGVLEKEFENLKQVCLKREQEKLQVNYELDINKLKLDHSIAVAILGKDIADNLRLFNEENLKILWSSFLLHDIGRFVQLSMTHTLKDEDSFREDSCLGSLYSNENKILDHGELGQFILKNSHLIEKFIPFNRIYDDFIGTVVGNHAKKDLPFNLSSKIVNEKMYLDYSLKELIKNNKKQDIDRLTGWFIRILQDVNRLDILKQFAKSDSIFKLSEEAKIDNYLYELFCNGDYLNISELKNKGLLTCSVEQLMILSFIYQTKLVNVIKEFKNIGLISRVWGKTECLESSYQFISELVDALIETSPDGIYIDKEKALVKVNSVI